MEVSRCLLDSLSQEGLSVKLTGKLAKPSASQLRAFLQQFRYMYVFSSLVFISFQFFFSLLFILFVDIIISKNEASYNYSCTYACVRPYVFSFFAHVQIFPQYVCQ